MEDDGDDAPQPESVVVGLSVSFPSFRDDTAREPELVAMRRNASRDISRQLGCTHFPLDPGLSLSPGCMPTFDDVEPEVQQAIEPVAARATAHGVAAGVHNGRASVAKAHVAMGFRWVTLASDARPAIEGSRHVLGAMRGGAGP